jgi:hypothetical protein
MRSLRPSRVGRREGEEWWKDEVVFTCVGSRLHVTFSGSCRLAALAGRSGKLEGTVVKRWGNPSHAAFDIWLDEGGWELFWYHELEEIDEVSRDARSRDG